MFFSKNKNFFSFLFTISLLFIFSQLINWNLFYQNIKTANFYIIVLCLIMVCLWPLFGFYRWKFILKVFSLNITNRLILNSLLISYSANLMLPAKSGDFSKAITISKSNKSKFIIPVIAERLLDVLSLSLISIIGSIYFQNKKYIMFSISIFFFITIFVISTPFLKKIKFFKIINNNSLRSFLENISHLRFMFLNKIKYVLIGFFFSMLNWIFASIQIWLFFLAYNTNIKLFDVMMLFPLAVLLSLLPITPGGIGVRETIFIILFSKFAQTHTCIIVSLNYYLFSIFILGLIGLIYFYNYLKN